MLTATAAHCRHAATVYDLDPTLADEPWREVDLLVELARQVSAMVRNALSDWGLDRWPAADRWAEAEALFERVGVIAEKVVTDLPRRDHAIAIGSRYMPGVVAVSSAVSETRARLARESGPRAASHLLPQAGAS
jgi:hypothetical protein